MNCLLWGKLEKAVFGINYGTAPLVFTTSAKCHLNVGSEINLVVSVCIVYVVYVSAAKYIMPVQPVHPCWCKRREGSAGDWGYDRLHREERSPIK